MGTKRMSERERREVLIRHEQQQADSYRRVILAIARKGMTDPSLLSSLTTALDGCNVRLRELGAELS